MANSGESSRELATTAEPLLFDDDDVQHQGLHPPGYFPTRDALMSYGEPSTIIVSGDHFPTLYPSTPLIRPFGNGEEVSPYCNKDVRLLTHIVSGGFNPKWKASCDGSRQISNAEAVCLSASGSKPRSAPKIKGYANGVEREFGGLKLSYSTDTMF